MLTTLLLSVFVINNMTLIMSWFFQASASDQRLLLRDVSDLFVLYWSALIQVVIVFDWREIVNQQSPLAGH